MVSIATVCHDIDQLLRERDDLADQRIDNDELWAENQELRAKVRRGEGKS